MAGWQQVIIVGNLGRDPEMRYTQGGIPICNFNVAVTTISGGGQGGQQGQQGAERQEKTVWFRVAAWRELGERCQQFLAKGKQVMVIGTIDVSAYMDKAGQAAAGLELTARDVRFLGSREDGGGRDDGGEPSSGGRGDYGASSGGGRGGNYAPQSGNTDDIPF
ncbi:MAG: single-stranded DNA-binding protein [Chloroflexota bacterium]|nr:single-stranded DNA-binding protein [Chloroflexota bacterium]